LHRLDLSAHPWLISCRRAATAETGGGGRWKLHSGEPAARSGQQASAGSLWVQGEGLGVLERHREHTKRGAHRGGIYGGRRRARCSRASGKLVVLYAAEQGGSCSATSPTRPRHGHDMAACVRGVRRQCRWAGGARSARPVQGAHGAWRKGRGSGRRCDDELDPLVMWNAAPGSPRGSRASAAGPGGTTVRTTRGVGAAGAFQSASACEPFSSSPI
jgi:hypothetical protein